MNLENQLVVTAGWGKPSVKGVPLLILFIGSDVEGAIEAANTALDNNVVSFARIFRGQLLGGQLMWSGTRDNRPSPAGPLIPPTNPEGERKAHSLVDKIYSKTNLGS
jgi:hypothetical protein